MLNSDEGKSAQITFLTSRCFIHKKEALEFSCNADC
jgi:hypothetical protein